MTTSVRDLSRDARLTTRNLSLVFLLRAFQYPFLVLYAVLVPRTMGPETYGQFALLLSFVAIAVSTADLGLSEVFGRFVPELEVRGERSGIERLSSSLLVLKLALDALVFGAFLGILVAVYGGRFPVSYLLAVLGAALVADVGSLPYALVFGLNDLVVHALRDPVRRVLNLILVLGLFRWLGLLGALLAALLVEGLLAAFYFVRARAWFRLDRGSVDLAHLQPYLGYGFVVYLSWGATILWFRSGNAVVDALTGNPAQVAYFDMASQGFSLTAVFTLMVLSSLIPMSTKLLLAGREDRLVAWAAVTLKAMSIFVTMLAVSFVLAGRDLVPWLLGPAYREVFPNAALQLFGMLPMVVAQVGMVFAVVHKRPGRYVAGLAAAFGSFLAAALLLVPRHGALGASIAMLASSVVLSVAMWLQYRRELAAGLGASARAAALGLPFLGLAWLGGGVAEQALLAAAFLAAYTALLFGARVLETRELRELYAAIRSGAATLPAAPAGS